MREQPVYHPNTKPRLSAQIRMKQTLYTVAFALLFLGTAPAQDVTKKEAVKTTKMAKENAKELKKEAKKAGNEAEAEGADASKKAAKEAKKQAKKNT